MFIAAAAAMKRAEMFADQSGTGYGELMERAGTLAAEKVLPSLKPGSRVLILCGKGNNGGDGLVMARVLAMRGHKPAVVFTMGTRLSPLARQNLPLLEQTGADILDLPLPEGEMQALLNGADMVVDAVFGTGFSGDLPEHVAALFRQVESAGLPVVALDLPSGMNCDTGRCSPGTLRASQTLAFACLKPAHLLKTSAPMCGHSTVLDIGITGQQLVQAGAFCQLDRRTAAEGLPRRAAHSHKGSYGRLLAVCGSDDMSGAALLCCEGALRCGAGLVKLLSPREVLRAAAVRLPECLLAPPGDLQQALGWADVAVCGCGLGLTHASRQRLHAVLAGFSGALVLDADALTLLAEDPECLRRAAGEVVLTPHIGEMARLCGRPAQDVADSRFDIAGSFAQQYGVTVVLKDSSTCVAAPDGRLWLFDGGNSGLAKGGSGDVLAGVIAALAAQGADGTSAALTGVWLHGAAADWARAELGEYGMLPSDVIRHLPQVLRMLAQGGGE